MVVEESCGAVVWKIDAGRVLFLVLHRADEDDVWEPPKGHRLPDETERETALRELQEEVDVETANLDSDFRAVVEYTNSGGVVLRYVFFLVQVDRVKLSAEHDDAKWITLDEITKYFKYDDIRSVYRQASEHILRFYSDKKVF